MEDENRQPLALERKRGIYNMDKKPVTPDTEDDESVDGCDVPIEHATADEDLPAAEGGVA